jgi:hypothetical protein
LKKSYSGIKGPNVDSVLASILRQVKADNNLLKGWKVTIEYLGQNGKRMRPATFYKKGGFFLVKFRKKIPHLDNYYYDKTKYRRRKSFTDEYVVLGDVFKDDDEEGWRGFADVDHFQF